MAEIEVVESKRIKRGVEVILGLPDVGLVGTIAATHIIGALKLSEMGYLESELFPPITVVHDHTPKSPIRLYGNDKLAVLVSEMPISPPLVYPLSKALVKWFKEKGASRVISIGGIAREDRLEIKTPEVYALPSDDRILPLLEKAGIKVFEEGLLVGSYSTILRMCAKKGISAVYLMADSHMRYPDPGAAASAIEAVNKITGLEIDVKSLKDKADEVRLTSKDLMKRTDNVMQDLQKTQEQEMPMMYR